MTKLNLSDVYLKYNKLFRADQASLAVHILKDVCAMLEDVKDVKSINIEEQIKEIEERMNKSAAEEKLKNIQQNLKELRELIKD